MKSTSQHVFAQAPMATIPRSSFRRDFTYKTAFDSGKLIPIYCDEALPGDTFNLKMTSFARLSTPIVPFMDNLFMDFHFFAVPLRLVWDNFQKMMGEQIDPGDSTDYLVPILKTNPTLEETFDPISFAVGSPADYLGIPTGIPGLEVSALFFRAMNLIWNEWYRDENLQDSLPVPRDDGPDDITANKYGSLLPRGKRKDYFTSALPWPQKGPGVEISIGESAPVYGNGALRLTSMESYGNTHLTKWSSSTVSHLYPGSSDGWTSGDFVGVADKSELADGQTTGLYADLSSANLVTINALREAFQIQRLFERDARGGTRYVEILRSHFGVISPDARLQRPEYLGGGSQPINIHTVAQTSSTDSTSPQGNLAAYGVSSSTGIGFTKSFVEHTIIIGFASVRADLTYQQGLPKMFSRRSRFDFYWPCLAHLGEQAILNREIYAQGSAVKDDDGNLVDDQPFGYQERWAEYRYGVSKITGKLRSTAATSLDVWHLAQKFASLPTLNEDFIKENVPLARVLAVQDEPQIIFDSVFSLNCVRPMPLYSVPGLIDHF